MRPFQQSLPLKLLKAREATQAFFRPILLQAGLTEQQWRVMRALQGGEELETRQLADICCLLSPSLSGIINRLEAAGYLERRRSTEDQRRIMIRLTEQSHQLFERISPRLEARYIEMVSQLSEEKIAQLSELLDEVTQLKP